MPLLIYYEETELQVKYPIWYNIFLALRYTPNRRRAPHVFVLWVGPPPMVWPILSHEDIEVYTPTASPRAPYIGIRHAILSFFDQCGRQSTTVEAEEASCPKKAWCS